VLNRVGLMATNEIRGAEQKVVIQRPKPKNLVAEHALLPAELQKFLILRKIRTARSVEHNVFSR